MPTTQDVAAVQAIYDKFGSFINKYRGGMPAGFLAAIIKHESGGNPNAIGDPSLGEVGLFQVENSFPPSVGVDPNVRYSVEGNVFLGCLDYQIRAIQLFLTFPNLIHLGTQDSWKLSRLAFSVGTGGTKSLINSASPSPGAVFDAIRSYVDRVGGVSLGSQSASKVQARVHAIDDQWTIGAMVSYPFVGQPTKIPAPSGITYTIPANVARYLAAPMGSLLLYAGIAIGAYYLASKLA